MRPLVQVLIACGAASPLTPRQEAFLAETRKAAAAASEEAGRELRARFESYDFRLRLFLASGSWALARMPSDELLRRLQESLAKAEFLSNFGTDLEWQRTHPGQPSLSLGAIEEYGHIPTMWELRDWNSPLVNGTPEAQWEILEAAERGLYGLPLSSKPLPVGPRGAEVQERPQYLSMNLRHVDVGVPRYGAFAAMVRNDVVRRRGLLLPSDSGGWENVCNRSVPSIQQTFRIFGPILCQCSGAFAGRGARALPGTVDGNLHTLLGNSRIFERVGGDLPHLVHQVLTPGVRVRPVEALMFLEGGLLGPLRPRDMKVMVASFPGLFGEGAGELRTFCKRHRLPLAWALGGGRTWDEVARRPAQLLPFVDGGSPGSEARLLDPETWEFTSAPAPGGSGRGWRDAAARMTALRARPVPDEERAAAVREIWGGLVEKGRAIRPLRAGDGCGADLCFGSLAGAAGEVCVCRSEPEAALAV